MSFTVLIPARLASTRLPNKPLADLGGLPMVVRVARRVQAVPDARRRPRVVVATDSHEVMRVCADHAVEAVLTRDDHLSGSDRLAEASELLGLSDEHIVVNVQGDEPLIEPTLVDAVAGLLARRPEASMSTAAHPIDHDADLHSPHVVKVVLDAADMALYFSRAPVPCWRDRPADGTGRGPEATRAPQPALRHIGIYGYRAGFLRHFPRLAPAPIERAEALEQLRAMWHGYRIAVHVTSLAPGPGVDTPDDLARVRSLLQA